MNDRFVPFGTSHGLAVLGVLVVCAALVRVARHVHGTPSERSLRRVLGWSILAFNVAWMAWLNTPGKFDLRWSLPLQMCDFGWMLAGCSLLSGGDPRRLRHRLLHYWGLIPTLISLATPSVEWGPGTVSFWSFFVTHAQILCAVAVNALAFGIRPTRRDAFPVIALTIVVGLAMTGLNLALDVNYWFTGPTTPSNPTPMDLLGPWPLRLVWLGLLVAGAFLATSWPTRRQ